MTALLSQEGSVIAKQSREGWFPSRATAGFRFGTTPALRATPPDSGGEPRYSRITLFIQPNGCSSDMRLAESRAVSFTSLALVRVCEASCPVSKFQ